MPRLRSRSSTVKPVRSRATPTRRQARSKPSSICSTGCPLADSMRTLPVAAAVVVLALATASRSEEHTSELQSQSNLVCRLLLEKKKKRHIHRLDRSEQAYRTRSRRPANQNHP